MGLSASQVMQNVLKVGVPTMGYKHFASQAGAQGFEFPPDCGSPHGAWVYGEIVSQPFLWALMFSSHLPDVKGLLFQFLVFFSRRSYSIYTVYSCKFTVSMEEEVNSDSFYIVTLNLNHYANVFSLLIGSGWII